MPNSDRSRARCCAGPELPPGLRTGTAPCQCAAAACSLRAEGQQSRGAPPPERQPEPEPGPEHRARRTASAPRGWPLPRWRLAARSTRCHRGTRILSPSSARPVWLLSSAAARERPEHPADLSAARPSAALPSEGCPSEGHPSAPRPSEGRPSEAAPPARRSAGQTAERSSQRLHAQLARAPSCSLQRSARMSGSGAMQGGAEGARTVRHLEGWLRLPLRRRRPVRHAASLHLAQPR